VQPEERLEQLQPLPGRGGGVDDLGWCLRVCVCVCDTEGESETCNADCNNEASSAKAQESLAHASAAAAMSIQSLTRRCMLAAL